MIIRTNKGNRRFKDPQGLFVTPYDENGLLGNDTYDIREIVGDTISITSDDATRTDIPDEFSDGNLYSNVKLGQRNFAADCIDFQNNIMKVLFGCEVKEDGSVLFPSEYKDINVMIRVSFEDCDLVIPMVTLDSKANLENLRTDVARGQIVGVAKVHKHGEEAVVLLWYVSDVQVAIEQRNGFVVVLVFVFAQHGQFVAGFQLV